MELSMLLMLWNILTPILQMIHLVVNIKYINNINLNYYFFRCLKIILSLYLFISESNLDNLKLLREFANWKPSSKNPQISLPSMSEDQFVGLCKTMYDLIENSSVDQEIHNNISKLSN